jgi:TonB-dependent SusC/RagA subfamily outer membrane receptor
MHPVHIKLKLRMKQFILAGISLLISYSWASAHFTGDITSVASLKTVIVYRAGAEMTHTASASIKQGSVALTIEGISNQLDINSLQINCPAFITLVGVEFSTNYMLSEEPNAAMRFWQDSLAKLQQANDKISLSINNTADLLEVLKTNRDIKGTQTGLSVAELMKLMEYYKLKSLELQSDLAGLGEKQKKLLTQMDKVKNQLAEEEKKNQKTGGVLHLQLQAATDGKADFTISYISQNAYWTPYYDIRVADVKNPATIIYKSKIVQTTGIDWKKVKLSLSSSVPNQWGNAPVLKSWFLSYVDPYRIMERNLSATNRIQSFHDKEKQLDEVVVTGYGGASNNVKIRGLASVNADQQPLYIVNGAPMSADDFSKLSNSAIKDMNVLKGEAATSIYGSRAANGAIIVTLKDGLEDYVSVTDNELNISFDIDIPYDVPSNGKEQTATLREFPLEALYKYYAVPKLDKDAYLLAEVSEWEKLNLLPGNANIIFEGTYVGKTFIDPNATADTLNLTLGRDKRVVIKREKLADFSSVKFLGSNKLQKITYELTVKNNKKDPVKMLLKDQYPLSTNKDIEVELLDEGNASVNKDLGVLTWKIELAPGESKKLRFSYSVKYDKSKAVNLN